MPQLTTLLFDYGNTLIAFGPAQQEAQLAAMRRVLETAGIAYDLPPLNALRKEQVLRPYHRDGIENDFREVCREVIALFADEATAEAHTEAMMQARYTAFLDSVSVDPAVPALLERLSRRYRLGLLSNYPCTASIRDSLDRLGLLRFFDTLVVSGDVGFAKPHPATYETLLNRMQVSPAECLYVGDNWLADVQGAKRLGLHAAWVREHIPYETFDPQPGDFPADLELPRLLDLEAALETFPPAVS